MICNDCGLPFDESDLSQVFEHEHKGLTFIVEDVKSKRVINDATDIYPGCSRQFACGVHTWINQGENYDQRLINKESEYFRSGYYQAQYELEDNYKMAR